MACPTFWKSSRATLVERNSEIYRTLQSTKYAPVELIDVPTKLGSSFIVIAASFARVYILGPVSGGAGLWDLGTER